MSLFKSRRKNAADSTSSEEVEKPLADESADKVGDDKASADDKAASEEVSEKDLVGDDADEKADSGSAGDGDDAESEEGGAEGPGEDDEPSAAEAESPDDSEDGDERRDEGAAADESADGAATDEDDGEPTEADEPAEEPAEEPADEPDSGKPRGKHAAVDSEGAADGAFVAAFAEIPKKKRRRGLKVFGITLGVIVAVLAIAYVAGAIVFMGRFLPNTVIGEQDVSLKSDAEVVAMLDEIAPNYRLDVIGGGFSYRATGDELGLSFDSQDIVDAMHADLNPWQWPLLIIQGGHDETGQLNVKYKPASYEDDVKAAVEKFNETAKDPVNATIAYDKKNDKFVVKPEEAGTKLDADAVLEAMADAIVALEPKASLGDEQLVQPTVLSTDDKLIEAAELATGMVSADLKLKMGGKNVSEVNGDTLSEFITVGDDYQVVFKDDEMNAWIDSLVASFNTVGTERTYTRADGKAIAVSGGVYGWEVDTEALKNAVLDGIKSGKATDIEVPCTETAEVFNGANQRDWGNRYLDVDITEQHVRFYGDDGKIIWEADCITGMPDGKHDTVKGVWSVNAKESPSKLIGYENGKKIYETSVKFWMPFEGNGIGFHDATWQPSFGGSMYANGYGSHGCVNLSYEDAETLYGIIEEGDVVVVHD